MTTPTALVVGGGIGGLTTAIALRQAGWGVRVLEAAPEISAVGAGIILQPNAMTALESLGAAEPLSAAGVAVEGARITTVSGRLVGVVDVSEGVTWGVGIHRAKLQRILWDLAGPENVRTSARVREFRLSDHGAVAVLESGEEVAGDVLVGADGIHSTVRAQHLADGEPRYCGYTCWRGLTERAGEFTRGEVFEIWGRGRRFGGMHVDERLYWFAPLNAPPGVRDEPGHAKATLMEVYAGWPESVRRTIESTPESSIMRHDIVDRPFRSGWGRGRMTLLGDAAHPMAPDQGQGACQAIEDAVVLGRCLAEDSDPAEALRRYERRRLRRTRHFVRRSHAFGQLVQLENAALRWLRDTALWATPRWVVHRDLRRAHRFAP
ncbi:MAG: FAD-dependent monooxygenase [Gemmatimonadota bacterium]